MTEVFIENSWNRFVFGLILESSLIYASVDNLKQLLQTMCIVVAAILGSQCDGLSSLACEKMPHAVCNSKTRHCTCDTGMTIKHNSEYMPGE